MFLVSWGSKFLHRRVKKITHVTTTKTYLFISVVVASSPFSQYKKGSGLSSTGSGDGAMSLMA
jgi:hypothetical protein